MILQAAGLTDVGLKREINQDSFIVSHLPIRSPQEKELRQRSKASYRFGGSDQGLVCAVADGLGGGNAGEVASDIVLVELVTHCQEQIEALLGADDGELEEFFQSLLESINERLFEAATESGREGMATTLTALVVFGPRAVWLQSGDSRLYRRRGRELELITPVHSKVGVLYQSGQINEEEARSHPQKNVISQCMGGTRELSFRPAVSRIELEPGDSFLLCSDGLTDGLWNEQIEERLAVLDGGAPVDKVVSQLVNDAKRASGVDNITGLVVQVDDKGAIERGIGSLGWMVRSIVGSKD